jgi:hypothetical protein
MYHRAWITLLMHSASPLLIIINTPEGEPWIRVVVTGFES